MPIYSYKCSGCGQDFDIKATLQEKNEGSKEIFQCTACHSLDIVQQITCASVVSGENKKSGGCGGCGCGGCH